MRVTLMNKNTSVLDAELNDNNCFVEIYEIFNIEYAPLSLSNAFNNRSISNVDALNDWFRGRGIPSWRRDLERLLRKLNVKSSDELLNKAYGLSLSDQYWIKPIDANISWSDINFFNNDFEYKGFLNASFDSGEVIDVSLYSPNNSTDGMLQKAWVIENGKRVLVKGTYEFSQLEPICEWLASNISKRLEMDFVNYTIDVLDGKLISKCDNFLTDDEEIMVAHDIFKSKAKSNEMNDYEHYVNVLADNGILDAKKKLSDMYLVDFLTFNEDRHLKNYGVVRNVSTLKWERVTPIFDTGEGLECGKNMEQLIYNTKPSKYKFFYNGDYDFYKLVYYINLKFYDFDKLNGLVEELSSVLDKYSLIIDLSTERKKIIISRLKERIEYLKERKASCQKK